MKVCLHLSRWITACSYLCFTNQHHKICLVSQCLPYIRPQNVASLHNHFENCNYNVCETLVNTKQSMRLTLENQTTVNYKLISQWKASSLASFIMLICSESGVVFVYGLFNETIRALDFNGIREVAMRGRVK